jgi:hypothetical protein
MTWSKAELHQVTAADGLHVSPFREDGVSCGTLAWIWSGTVDEAIYGRGDNGEQSRWYQAAIRQGTGRISVAGMIKDVSFEPVDGPTNDRIDQAYRAKYGGSPYLGSMTSDRARAATVKILPREQVA